MRRFENLSAVAAPLLRANVDTDAIIPSREMKTVGKSGLADGLFAGWRYTTPGGREPDPRFVLNQPAYAHAAALLVGENFGCGSSREHAVWALEEFGIRAIIAPSFAPIFRANCVRNGIVPIVLPLAAVEALAAAVAPDPQQHRVEIELASQKVRAPGDIEHDFAIDAESKAMLLEGLDAIDLTLRSRGEIAAFLESDRRLRPWVYLDGYPIHRGTP